MVPSIHLEQKNSSRDTMATKSDAQGNENLFAHIEVKCHGEHIIKGIDVRVCGDCESCHVFIAIQRTQDWFNRASEQTKRIFLIGLSARMGDEKLIGYVLDLLRPMGCKDYTYARARPMPGLVDDMSTISGDRALDYEALQTEIVDIWKWFQSASHYAKVNYILTLLKMCESTLLLALMNQLRTASAQVPKSLEQTLLANHPLSKQPRLNDSVESNGTDVVDDTESVGSIGTFATEDNDDLSFMKMVKGDEFYTNNARNPITGKTFARESRQRKFKRQKSLEKKAGIIKKLETGKDKESSIDLTHQWVDTMGAAILSDSAVASSGVAGFRDLICDLPVHLSKYILNFLSKPTLEQCAKVNKIWKVLAGQVIKELSIHAELQKQWAVIKSSSAKGCNPAFARDLCILAPETISAGSNELKVKKGYSPEKQDLSRPASVNFDTAYFGYYTRTIYVEEKNIYCGSYNTLILENKEDENRVIHYNGGSMIAVASDKRIEVISVSTAGKRITTRPILGHAGSIQCIYIVEEEGYLITGSYDTSIRIWNIESGCCKRILKGHTDTVYCIAKRLDILVSGSKDCTLKVWDLKQDGKLLMTLHHKNPVLCAEISGNKLIGGDAAGAVRLWDMRGQCLIKEMTGHEGAVLCVRSDKWHIASGGKDGNVLLWSTVGKFVRCLGVFRHPKPVMSVYFKDMRILTGCMDGKIRIWNALTGDCLRLMRGNSRSEPISHIWPHGDKMIINTLGNILALTFEPVDYDYSLSGDHPSVAARMHPAPSYESEEMEDKAPPYPHIRAQRMLRVGSANVRLFHNSNELESQHRQQITSNSIGINVPVRMSHSARSLSRHSLASAKSMQKRPLTAGSRHGDYGTLSICGTEKTEQIGGGNTSGEDEELELIGLVHSKKIQPRFRQPSLSVTEGQETKEERRRNSAMGGSIQCNKSKLLMSEALTLLRSQKRQASSRHISQDQVLLTVNMIRNALQPGMVEMSANTQANADFSSAASRPSSVASTVRPGSAPMQVDSRKKTMTTSFIDILDADAIKDTDSEPIPPPKATSIVTKLIHEAVHLKQPEHAVPMGIHSTIPSPSHFVQPRRIASAPIRTRPPTCGTYATKFSHSNRIPTATAISAPSSDPNRLVLSSSKAAIPNQMGPVLMFQNDTKNASAKISSLLNSKKNVKYATTVKNPFHEFSYLDLRTTTQQAERDQKENEKKRLLQKKLDQAKRSKDHKQWVDKAQGVCF